MSGSEILRKSLTALNYGRQNGWLSLARLIKARLGPAHNPFAKISVAHQYDELIAPPFGKTINAEQVSPMTINWFVPPVGKGSGGHLNIFRFMRILEDLGYENRIIIVGEPRPVSVDIAKNEIDTWFFHLKAEVYVGASDDIPAAYFAMATSWPTAYYVRRFRSCIQKCYFVQDYEPWFFPAGTDSLLAEDTYRFGFFGFTAGSWLAGKLQDEYGMRTHAFGFSYDRDLYRPMPGVRKQDGVRRVLFYARPPTARRAFELGILVLREACKQAPDIRIVLAGWDVSGYDIPFPYEHAGLVELDQLAELYAQCDAALVLSCSNLSLLPLELMACGVPVVSNRAPYTQWLLNEENAMLAEPSITGLAQAVKEVVESPVLADKLSEAGLAFAGQTCWTREAKELADQLAAISASRENDCAPEVRRSA